MNYYNNTNGGFDLAMAPSNSNQVLIFNGLYGCLKVLANAEKYFNAYYPDFYAFDSKGKKSKIPTSELKRAFIHLLDLDYKFTGAELFELSKILKVKIPTLEEQGNLFKQPKAKAKKRTARSIAQDKRIKAKSPGKRISKTGRPYSESRSNRSDIDRRKRI